MTPSLGSLVQSFFVDHLAVQKGLRVNSIRSYRDTIRLFLSFVAGERRQAITRLTLLDLTCDRVLGFLAHTEAGRGNGRSTRNQRRAALMTFFTYLALRVPEMLAVCQQVAAIPVKRVPPPSTHYLDEQEMAALFRSLPQTGHHALRDRTLLLFLYNTGARAQEVADVRCVHLDLRAPALVQLHGKGDKWRTCPLWEETRTALKRLLADRGSIPDPDAPVFCAHRQRPLTRFGIYKIVRRHASSWDSRGGDPRRVTPHLLRHTAAVHLLESGVEVNVIRGWLGHVSLETTNRYAEITMRAKEKALRECEVHYRTSMEPRACPAWRSDKTLLDWLNAL